MNIQEDIVSYLIQNYGHLVLSDSPEYNEELELWISKLHSDYPILIQDDKKGKKEIHFIKIHSLGYIVFNSQKQIVRDKTTSDEQVVLRIETYLDMWRTYAENIVVSASAERIAKLSEVSNVLNPIYEIITFVSDSNFISLFHFEKERTDKRRKAKQYLAMLEDLKLLRRHDNGYVPGNLFVALKEQTDAYDQFMESIYATILKHRYSFLRNVLNLSNLETVIRIANIVYYPELHTRESVPRDRKTLVREYTLEYRLEITEPRMSGYLKKLEELDVIRIESGFYQGNDELRTKMFDIQKSIESPESLWSVPIPV